MVPTGAKTRRTATVSAKETTARDRQRQKEIAGDKKRQATSTGTFFVSTLMASASALPAANTCTGLSNFFGGKTDNRG